MFHHPARAVGNYSSGPPVARDSPNASRQEVSPDLMVNPVQDRAFPVPRHMQPNVDSLTIQQWQYVKILDCVHGCFDIFLELFIRCNRRTYKNDRRYQ